MSQGEIDSSDDSDPPDVGVWTVVDPQSETIRFREDPMYGSKIDRVRPFSQVCSDAPEPIRIVEDAEHRMYVMQGNHRIYGAREDGFRELRVLLYSVEQWQDSFGFFRAWGTNNPRIIR